VRQIFAGGGNVNAIPDLARFFDPLALAIVFGGSLLAAVLRGGWAAFGQAFAALRIVFTADPEADSLAATVAIGRVEAISEAKGIVCADRIATTGRFLREAVRRLADASGSDAFTRWAGETLDARARRHAIVATFWQDLANAAPAMGMIATVLGLVRMFAQMDDPSKIGAPMATALIATLWGILVANLIAGPVADRLERLSDAECAWQRRVLDHFMALARAEPHSERGHARGVQQTLQQRLAS
jgi:chemotaxis protein MotA